jgi:hypothetical protein
MFWPIADIDWCSANVCLRGQSGHAIGTLRHLRRLSCMSEHENADRARAERIFKAREFQKADATKATADYYAAQQRVRDRTQQLRRLRFEREAQKKVLSD